MRVIELEVKNYRSIQNTVRWELRDGFEVLHGDNNAGKSNLISALRLATELLVDDGWLSVRLDGQLPRAWDDDLLRPPIAHRATPAEPTRLRLRTADPDVEATFELTHDADEALSSVRVVQWSVGGDPFTLPPLNTEPAAAVMLPRHARRGPSRLAQLLGLPAPLVRYMSPDRRPPEGATSWDAWFITGYEDDLSSAGEQRKASLQASMRAFEALLGPGRLEEKRRAGIPCLVWVSAAGDVVPFSEQGSGVRAAKDVLIAVAGSEEPVVVIEEPETHQSEATQLRLRDELIRATRRSKRQVILTSHVFAFDSPTCSHIRRDPQGETVLTRHAPTEPGADGTTTQAMTAALQREYAEASVPSPAFISSGGLLRLPDSVRQRMSLPDITTFAAFNDGTFLLVPEAIMKKWSARDDE